MTSPNPNNVDGSETFSCPNSGFATRSGLDPNNVNTHALIVFDNCVGESFSANGTLTRKLKVIGSRWSSILVTSLELDNYEFSDGTDNRIQIETGSTRRATGTYNSRPPCSDITGTSLMYEVTGLHLLDDSTLSQFASGNYESNYRQGSVTESNIKFSISHKISGLDASLDPTVRQNRGVVGTADRTRFQRVRNSLPAPYKTYADLQTYEKPEGSPTVTWSYEA